ncbi:hypothetical protein VP1G_08536 [Cytospora mali]|uniref:Uncharacterized protein n=1 Tax=Cytospora mali TaxID=578113 RepID=A0A194VC63_CYTMA|nr:hypothetical protein VP1G_08536 [Valsa mali var. pyri (nom. inval.)]
MNRQSGSHLPIPVTPKETPEQPLLQSSPKQHRRSREGRASFSLFPGKQKVSPIWRPSTGHTPPAPQWPLPRVPIRIHEENPALTRTYTMPRGAPLPPPRTACSSRSSSGSSTTTLTEDHERSPGSQGNASPSPSSPATPRHPRSPRTPSNPPRRPLCPPLHQRGATNFQTRYLNMLLNLDKIPRAHNILANVLSWMVLVGFVIAPGNFTSPEASLRLSEKDQVTSTLLTTTTHLKGIPSIPLLVICSVSVFLGVVGIVWLAVYWRRNYIWLMNRVYLPLLLNSLAGFIATLVIIHVQHRWYWSVGALVTVAVEGASLAISLGLFVLYDYWLLAKLKREHCRETSRKRVVDLVKAGKAPPFAPGSVV